MSEICSYNYKFKTASFDIGVGAKLRLSALLKYQEQAGEEHLANDFSLDYLTLAKSGVVFVLTNTAVKIHRLPTFHENITIDTWNKQTKGFKFFRGYDWYDEKGEKIIESVSAFVLVSATEHKIMRPNAFPVNLPKENRENAVENPIKTHIPDEMSFVDSKKVLYSMLDSNNHLNNTLYADFLVDFIDSQKAGNVKGFTIDFVKEAKLDEKIEVFKAEQDGKIFIEGINNENCCFRASIEY